MRHCCLCLCSEIQYFSFLIIYWGTTTWFKKRGNEKCLLTSVTLLLCVPNQSPTTEVPMPDLYNSSQPTIDIHLENGNCIIHQKAGKPSTFGVTYSLQAKVIHWIPSAKSYCCTLFPARGSQVKVSQCDFMVNPDLNLEVISTKVKTFIQLSQAYWWHPHRRMTVVGIENTPLSHGSHHPMKNIDLSSTFPLLQIHGNYMETNLDYRECAPGPPI
jgi:hypothetical protein